MDNEIKEDDLIFGDAMLLPNEDENWKFILADRTYTLDAPTEVIISRMLKQLLAEQAKNKKLVEALEKITKIGTKCDDCSICPHQDENNYCDMECRQGMTELAKQALDEVNK